MFSKHDKDNKEKLILYCKKGRILVKTLLEGENKGMGLSSLHFNLLSKVSPPGPGYNLLTERCIKDVLIREAALYLWHQDSSSFFPSSLTKEVKQ